MHHTTPYQKPMRLRRCQLAVPGSDEYKMAKAVASSADHVFLDLEDSVAPLAKKDARAKIVKALKTLDWGSTVRCVRINDLESPYAYGDIIDIVKEAGDFIDVIMIPKVKRARDVQWVETLLMQLEQDLGLKKQIGLEALIEEVEAMINVEEIACASPRLEAIIFGMGDYSASQGVVTKSIGGQADYPGDVWHYARNKMIIAARAAGIDAVDGPYADFKDDATFAEECKRALTLGCVGKWAIHPAQIETALMTFSPDPVALALARKLSLAYQEAEAKGVGAIQVDGILVDVASVRMYRNIITRAEQMGL